MVLELVATCIIGAGIYYTPPEGWRLEATAFSGTRDVCNRGDGGRYLTCFAINVEPIKDNTVTLRKTVQVGEAVKAPKECSMTVESKTENE